MLHDGPDADTFELSTDWSCYDSYDITDLDFVSKSNHKFSYCFFT